MVDNSHQRMQRSPFITGATRVGYPLLIALLAAAYAAPAHAYIDPGTGSILLQGLLAAVATIGLFWQRVKLFFASILASRRPNTSKAREGERGNPQE